MASASVATTYTVQEKKRPPFLVDLFLRLVREKPLGTVGGVVVIILFLTGVFADVLAPYGYNEIVLADRLSPPSARHILGADNLGRDLLSRIIYGARISMYVGLAGSAIDVAIATFIGLISGFFGGKTDITIQRFVDAWLCFPSLFIYLTVMAILGPGLIQVIMVLGVSSGIRSSRTVRSAVIGIKENVYLEAAKAIGAQNRRILTRHILPNVMAPIIIIFTIAMGGMILQESTLSFLGFGIPPPIPSWGGMLSGSGRTYMLQAPWMALWPGLALAIVVYGINMLGDAMRDLLDPRLRGGLGRYSGVKRKMPKQLSQA
ncbi:MAG: ABC transporter permease [Chloroflexi bacterium]|nr:ABC transporter permease [Chloroflexota bacterium]MBI2979213.1 ABC transporter permease [Chloroflexota bacterium]